MRRTSGRIVTACSVSIIKAQHLTKFSIKRPKTFFWEIVKLLIDNFQGYFGRKLVICSFLALVSEFVMKFDQKIFLKFYETKWRSFLKINFSAKFTLILRPRN